MDIAAAVIGFTVFFTGAIIFVLIYASKSGWIPSPPEGPKLLAEELGIEYKKSLFSFAHDWIVEGVYNSYHIDLRCTSGSSYKRITLTIDLKYEKKFTLKIQSEGAVSRIAKLVGLKDIDSGDPVFDEKFIVRSNDKLKTGSLLMDPSIRGAIMRNMSQRSSIKIGKGKTRFIEPHTGSTAGEMNDKDRLRDIIDMMIEIAGRIE